jgi:hypothetical protein
VKRRENLPAGERDRVFNLQSSGTAGWASMRPHTLEVQDREPIGQVLLFSFVRKYILVWTFKHVHHLPEKSGKRFWFGSSAILNREARSVRFGGPVSYPGAVEKRDLCLQ